MCAFMYLCVCVFVYAFLFLWKCGNVEIKVQHTKVRMHLFTLLSPPNRRNLVALEFHIWKREGGVGLFAVFLTHGNGDIGRVT